MPSAKQDLCSHMWVLDDQNIGKVARGYPMFFNRASGGCGAINTGDVPRVSSLARNIEWSDTNTWACGCYGIR